MPPSTYSTHGAGAGAVDSSVVQNASQIGWNKVAQFEPFGVENNVSSYLQWAIQISGFSVCSSAHVYIFILNQSQVNGTQMAPVPTYPLQTKNISLALFDV